MIRKQICQVGIPQAIAAMSGGLFIACFVSYLLFFSHSISEAATFEDDPSPVSKQVLASAKALFREDGHGDGTLDYATNLTQLGPSGYFVQGNVTYTWTATGVEEKRWPGRYFFFDGNSSVIRFDSKQQLADEAWVETSVVPNPNYSDCIARGTDLLTENGPLPIESIQIGQNVWGYDVDTGKKILTPVTAISSGIASQTVVLGGACRLTANHSVFADGAWVDAGTISPVTELMNTNSQLQSAGLPQIIKEDIQVYDLKVAAPFNYFAGGILVHNMPD